MAGVGGGTGAEPERQRCYLTGKRALGCAVPQWQRRKREEMHEAALR